MDSRYKNRETLKSYFRKGQVPTEEQFAALIDSLYNVSEDGCLTVSEDDGLKLYPTGNERTVTSIYREKPVSPEDRPLWRVTLGDDGSLAVSDGHDGKNILLIGTDGVTVPGELKAGRYTLPDKSREDETPDGFGTLQVKADGRWHDLPVEAAAGRPGTGAGYIAFQPVITIPAAGNILIVKSRPPIRTEAGADCSPHKGTGGAGRARSNSAGRNMTASSISRCGAAVHGAGRSSSCAGSRCCGKCRNKGIKELWQTDRCT